MKNITENILDVIETLELAFKDKRQFYEMADYDSPEKKKVIFTREQYLEFLIGGAIDNLGYLSEELNEKEKRILEIVKE